MADTVEMQDIRGLDIDKFVKGFGKTNYVFKGLVNVSSTSADHIRWYQRTAGDRTATAPSVVANVSPLSIFPTLEESWTRNTSYVKKYAAEGFISMEDMKSSDIDVVTSTLGMLTRAVIKQVDSDIYNVLTENQSPTNIGTGAATGNGWDDTTNGNPILDIMAAKQAIAEEDYDAENGIIAMDPKNHKDLLNYIITIKGSSIPAFSSEKVRNGVVMNILGMGVVVSNNVVADSVYVGKPDVSCTWRSHTDTTSAAIEEKGIGTKFRVWELGIGTLTDPKASYLITDTNA